MICNHVPQPNKEGRRKRLHIWGIKLLHPIRSFPENDRSGKRPDLFERARLVAIDHPYRMVLKQRKEE
jgi:hypothetical protein